MVEGRKPQLTISGPPPRSKEEFAYQTLRKAIINGQLEPGTQLVQTDLAEHLGVSTIPIRTAMQRLATEGLVSLEENRPPSVSILSPDELEEVLLIRMHLELLAAELSFPELGAEDLEALWDLVRKMEHVLEQGNPHLYGPINKDFHMRLFEPCQCPKLAQMITDLWDNTDRHRSQSMFVAVPGLAEQSLEEHRQLLGLLENEQFDRAIELLRRHKLSARERFLRCLGEGADTGGQAGNNVHDQ
jgi:DNA-binding GntR family transcriptional regulator